MRPNKFIPNRFCHSSGNNRISDTISVVVSYREQIGRLCVQKYEARKCRPIVMPLNMVFIPNALVLDLHFKAAIICIFWRFYSSTLLLSVLNVFLILVSFAYCNAIRVCIYGMENSIALRALRCGAQVAAR